MKVMKIRETSLDNCVRETQKDNVVVLQNGKPIVLIRSVKGLDLEQVYLGQSDEFWQMIEQRRKSKSISWEEMEEKMKDNVIEKSANGKKKSVKENRRANGKRLAASGKSGRN